MTLSRLLATLLLVTMFGTAAELLLLEHYEDPWQYTPLVLLALTFAGFVWHAKAPGKAAREAFRSILLVCLMSAAVGLWLHYRANTEFELEMYPDLGGLSLFWKAIRGAAPPTLAPGAMVIVALAGFAWSASVPDNSS